MGGMQPGTAPAGLDGPGLAGMLLLTAREALGVSQRELAVATGCSEELVRRIESGGLDPAMDTVERILNGSGLELRAGPAPPDDRYCGSLVDRDEATRLRSSIASTRSFRRQIGAPPAGPPAGALPDWDGEDPAPPRRFGAADGRRDGGGWAAILVRSAIAQTQRDRHAFARACGLDEEALERIAAGRERPSTSELAAMLTRAGSGLRVRIEVYDDHDDGLHLSAQADPDLHRPRRRGVSQRRGLRPRLAAMTSPEPPPDEAEITLGPAGTHPGCARSPRSRVHRHRRVGGACPTVRPRVSQQRRGLHPRSRPREPAEALGRAG